MISFDVARAWHEIYALRLQLMLDGIGGGGRSADDVCDATACELGAWIHGTVAQQVREFGQYQELLKTHGEFHRRAYEMVSAFNAGDVARARQIAANEFIGASEAVLASLNALEAECQRRLLADPTAVMPGLGRSIAVSPEQRAWNETLRIGFPVIDEQHRMLSELVEKLIAEPAAMIDSERTSELFFNFSRLVEMHFETEESVMRHCGMPTDIFERHKREHTAILAECAEVNLQVMAGRLMTVVDVFPLLRNMIVGHIVDYDLDIKAYLEPALVS